MIDCSPTIALVNLRQLYVVIRLLGEVLEGEDRRPDQVQLAARVIGRDRPRRCWRSSRPVADPRHPLAPTTSPMSMLLTPPPCGCGVGRPAFPASLRRLGLGLRPPETPPEAVAATGLPRRRLLLVVSGASWDARGNTTTTSEPFTTTSTGSVRLFLNVTTHDHSASPAGKYLPAL
mgnify:CR=1 FL=1